MIRCGRGVLSPCCLDAFSNDRAGTRTQDLALKRRLLYRLSYAISRIGKYSSVRLPHSVRGKDVGIGHSDTNGAPNREGLPEPKRPNVHMYSNACAGFGRLDFWTFGRFLNLSRRGGLPITAVRARGASVAEEGLGVRA